MSNFRPHDSHSFSFAIFSVDWSKCAEMKCYWSCHTFNIFHISLFLLCAPFSSEKKSSPPHPISMIRWFVFNHCQIYSLDINETNNHLFTSNGKMCAHSKKLFAVCFEKFLWKNQWTEMWNKRKKKRNKNRFFSQFFKQMTHFFRSFFKHKNSSGNKTKLIFSRLKPDSTKMTRWELSRDGTKGSENRWTKQIKKNNLNRINFVAFVTIIPSQNPILLLLDLRVRQKSEDVVRMMTD